MKNYSLLSHNTFGIEAEAAEFLEYRSENDLRQWIDEGVFALRPYFCIGGGSNLLFTQKRYDRTFLHSAIRGMEVTYENRNWVEVRVGSGVLWDDFVQHCVDQGWYGAENLSLIPGEVGAAAVQNIGAYGAEVCDLIDSVETMDVSGVRRTYHASECSYAYRNSIFKSPSMKSVFILYVNFRLSKHPFFRLDYGNLRQEVERGGEVTLAAVRRAVMDIRRSKLPDPAILGNAGSFFMNPIIPRKQYEDLCTQFADMPCYPVDADHVKVPAGWLIERAGWKGRSLGRAGVHDKQALVLVNLGGADGSDILALSDAVQKSVSDKFGITIRPEVNFI
ncbi:UDP-N-acetylmuramate dehydrogenase [uncultured Mediterranea sp.]|uniref:UDP-N-acetylmuramate dehydrogenase n=1 Tax=uncultured Mediterranea sp. TaxID=1926662 RepID=UPI0027D97A93|nr:UDP-N-acetylmuramate dehydrogenase [uncultured Mediterranea sp.]